MPQPRNESEEQLLATLLHSEQSTAHCCTIHNTHYFLHTAHCTLHTALCTPHTTQSLKHSPLLLRTVLCGSLRASLRGLQVNRPYRHPAHISHSVWAFSVSRDGTKVAPSGLLPASGSEIVAPGQDHRSSRWSCQCLTRQCVSESVDPSFSVTITPITILLIATFTINSIHLHLAPQIKLNAQFMTDPNLLTWEKLIKLFKPAHNIALHINM